MSAAANPRPRFGFIIRFCERPHRPGQLTIAPVWLIAPTMLPGPAVSNTVLSGRQKAREDAFTSAANFSVDL